MSRKSEQKAASPQSKPAAKQSDAKPGDRKAVASKAVNKAAKAEAPDTKKPAAKKPEASKPAAMKSDSGKSKAKKSDSGKSAPSKSGAGKSDIKKSKAKKSDKKKSEAKEVSPQPERIKSKFYEKELERLQVELVKLQLWVKHAGLKVCVVFEGRDGAGKGGSIKALTERVSPRIFQVVALPAPSEREKSQMYMQRYVRHFPSAGEVVIFDRSWYNRAGVEPVLGFCTQEQTDRFLDGVPALEKSMVDSGIILIKFWLEVSEEEQTKRLQARVDDGRKLWKLSPMDMKSYSRWYDYSRARDAMFKASDTGFAPWIVVPSDDKRRAQLNLIRHLLDHVPYQELPRAKITFPKRQARGDYQDSKYPFNFVKDRY